MEKKVESDERYICAGKFIDVYGKHGALKFISYLTNIEDISGFDYLYVKNYYKLKIEKTFLIKKGAVIKIANFNSSVQSELLVGQECYLEKDLILKKLPKNHYYENDIIGMKVYAEKGEYIGKIKNIIYTGANDVWEIIDNNDSEILLPAIDDVIQNIDLESKKVFIKNFRDYL